MCCPLLLLNRFLLASISGGELDLTRWDLAFDGIFHLRLAWEFVRCSRARDEVFWLSGSGISHFGFPFFSGDYCMGFWLLMMHCARGFLAIDDALWSRVFYRVSWCVYGWVVVRLLSTYLLIAHEFTRFGLFFL